MVPMIPKSTGCSRISADRMMTLAPIAPVIKEVSAWLVVWSTVTFVCGILAIILPLTISFGIAVVIGCLILAAGIGHLFFAFETRSVCGLLWQVLLSTLHMMAAICLLANPLLSILSLSFLLAIFLLLESILEFALYFRLRRFRHSIWLLVDGIGTLTVGILMVTQWPPASPETIGALIGISLMLSAVSRLIFTVAIRALNPANA
jgi:uncharacterized membrane protein HdeD (DUF308 family)